VIATPIVLSLLILGIAPAERGPETRPDSNNPAARDYSDHAQLMAALERLARTGEPRHVTHDEGEELGAALKEALADGADPDLQWLSTRAAVPIVPTIEWPLSSRTRPGILRFRAERVLTLPWPVEYVANVDARLDEGEWQPILRLKSGTTESRALDKLLRDAAAMRPGFHRLMLRARMRYSQPAGTARRETRNLLTVHYGIYGPARGATDPVRPFFDAAASVSAATLDPNLPDIPFTAWLKQLPREDLDERIGMFWTTAWCGLHESLSDEGLVPGDVCAVAHRSGPRPGTEIEAWLKIGALKRGDDENPAWVRTPPALVAAYVRDGVVRMHVPLSTAPGYWSHSVEEWPSVRLITTAAGISVSSPTIVPGVPTTLRVAVANVGEADAHGVTITVTVGSDAGAPVLRRMFVRRIPAAGSVEVEMPVVFPGRYGLVDVLLFYGHDNLVAPPRFALLPEDFGAVAVVNQREAPGAFVQRVRLRCIRNGRRAEFCP